jgi:hypothetical protein
MNRSLLPSEIEDPGIGYNLKASVMILDNKFNVTGETRIDRGRHWFHNFLVTKAGMHIQVRPEHYQSEDDLVFDIFVSQARN